MINGLVTLGGLTFLDLKVHHSLGQDMSLTFIGA